MTEPEMWEADGHFLPPLLQIKAAEAGKSLLFCIRRRSPRRWVPPL